MSQQTTGIIIGGMIPALLFGVSSVLYKASNQAGIGLGLSIAITGIAIAALGACIYLLIPDNTISAGSGVFAAGFGLLWGMGSAGIAVALTQYKVPLGKLTPLYNMNTLVAVLLALWVFAEWKHVRVPQLVLGALLIIAGGIVVAAA